MSLKAISAVVFAAGLAASAASAQDARTYIMATYYKCNQATETKADALYKASIAPVVKKQVDAGRLISFGYARHWMGGDWRRLEYMGGSDLAATIAARNAIIADLTGPAAKAGDEFTALCPSHDDYIWASVASSDPLDAVARERSKVAMSTYFECDSREREADAIVKTAFAPVMNAHVKEGKIARWSWMEHMAGGKYRRILVLDGADHTSLLKYWSLFAPALDKAQPELSRRFSDICHSHTDYIWDIGTE